MTTTFAVKHMVTEKCTIYLGIWKLQWWYSYLLIPNSTKANFSYCCGKEARHKHASLAQSKSLYPLRCFKKGQSLALTPKACYRSFIFPPKIIAYCKTSPSTLALFHVNAGGNCKLEIKSLVMKVYAESILQRVKVCGKKITRDLLKSFRDCFILVTFSSFPKGCRPLGCKHLLVTPSSFGTANSPVLPNPFKPSTLQEKYSKALHDGSEEGWI